MSVIQDAGFKSAAYMASWTTGVLGATLAADAPVCAIRNGPTQTAFNPSTSVGVISTQRWAYITEIGVRVSGVVAFTAAQQFGLYLRRFSVASLAGGAAAPILKVSSSTAPDSACLTGGPEGGDLRVATTAALTVVGVTFDANKIPIFGWSTVGPAEFGSNTIYLETEPIRLAPGEGLVLANQIVWPAAGTAIVNGYIKFDERFQ